MTICKITGYACHCQPDEGIPCNGVERLRESYQEWRTRAERMEAERDQLRGNLSLAEEGLANYAQELEDAKHDIERLSASLSAEVTESERLRDELTACQLERDRLRGALRGIMLTDQENPTRMRIMACEALAQPTPQPAPHAAAQDAKV